MSVQTPARPPSRPWAFLVTFTCYGAHLHGSDSGSVHRRQNLPGSPYLPENRKWADYDRRSMKEPVYLLDAKRRRTVVEAIRDACHKAGWNLHAIHARSNHAHVVVQADARREELLARLKGRASPALGVWDPARKRKWSRHGSVRELWSARSVDDAVEYVMRCQAEPMEAWENRDRWMGRRLPVYE